ncbi:DUF4007 family protein [Candidatus Thiothrix sp. Deng01]|uniref:DUF4007 family protein n=1 Tax=Candidatus Thiothrix phosphatis TaxID=3112415 RepID=A0ABU6D3D2_9GAMM|nr:DUF4007 family protein [Candidatus Thiothrix sp. Deng01]MEB4593563.1 DUF4007 family protein [Candidatus Thiothrix sp. Deng01]
MVERKSLPLNFPQTFLPERRLLAKLLAFAAEDGRGEKTAIGEQTGIPTGESTGKVEPMIYYCQGMGLVTANRDSGEWRLGLTALGRVVFQEDRYLGELHTLWLLHLLLCRRLDLASPPTGVADVWFTLFAESHVRLGTNFSQQDFLNCLIERYGEKTYTKSLAGVAIRTYLEESCLGMITALRQQGSGDDALFGRCSAPSDRSYYPVYAAYLYLIWDELFEGENQIGLDRLAGESRCFVLMGWDNVAINRWLEWMVDKGLIQLDRYTGTAMLLRLGTTAQVVGNIYSELI